MATHTTPRTFAQAFEQQVSDLLQDGIATIVDEEVAAAQQRVEQRVRELVGQKAISAASFAEIQHMGSGLVIRIQDHTQGGPR